MLRTTVRSCISAVTLSIKSVHNIAHRDIKREIDLHELPRLIAVVCACL